MYRTISVHQTHLPQGDGRVLEQNVLATYRSNPHLAKLPKGSHPAPAPAYATVVDTITTMSKQLAQMFHVPEHPISVHTWRSSAIAMADSLPNKTYTALEWHIFVDPQELAFYSEAEQRFIIGHELAHLYLHHPEDRICNDTDSTLYAHEYAADYVSATLLCNMPGAVSALAKWQKEDADMVACPAESSHPTAQCRIIALQKSA